MSALHNDELASLEAGLDALETPEPAAGAWWRGALSSAWPPLVAVALLLLAWELAYRAELAPPYALPSPADVGLVLLEQLRDGTLVEAVQTSVTRGGTGFLVAVSLGTPLGLLVGRVRAVRRGIGPILSYPGCRACPRSPGYRRRSSSSVWARPRSTPSSCSARSRRSRTGWCRAGARARARAAAGAGPAAQRHEPGLRRHPGHPARRHRRRAVPVRADRAPGAAPTGTAAQQLTAWPRR